MQHISIDTAKEKKQYFSAIENESIQASGEKNTVNLRIVKPYDLFQIVKSYDARTRAQCASTNYEYRVNGVLQAREE